MYIHLGGLWRVRRRWDGKDDSVPSFLVRKEDQQKRDNETKRDGEVSAAERRASEKKKKKTPDREEETEKKVTLLEREVVVENEREKGPLRASWNQTTNGR